MTNTTKIFLGIGILGVGYFAYRAYKIGSSLVYSTKNFSWNGSLTNPVIDVTLSVFNPSQYSVEISNLRGTVYYKSGSVEKPVFFVSVPGVKTITSNQITDADLMLQPLQSALNDGSLSAAIANYSGNIFFKGWVNVQNIPIPLNINVL